MIPSGTPMTMEPHMSRQSTPGLSRLRCTINGTFEGDLPSCSPVSCAAGRSPLQPKTRKKNKKRDDLMMGFHGNIHKKSVFPFVERKTLIDCNDYSVLGGFKYQLEISAPFRHVLSIPLLGGSSHLVSGL